MKTQTETAAVTLVPTPINTTADIQIDQSQIISYGIAQKENALEAADAAMKQELVPLIARLQKLEEENTKELPAAAEKEAKRFHAAIRDAFTPLGLRPVFSVADATIAGGRGRANLRVAQNETSYSSHLDSEFAFDLPAGIVENLAAIQTLTAQINAGREYQVALKKQLANLGREERNMRGLLAKNALEQSTRGQEILAVIEGGMIPIPQAPNLLALGDGSSASTGAARTGRRSKRG